jgi:hypothetical protein
MQVSGTDRKHCSYAMRKIQLVRFTSLANWIGIKLIINLKEEKWQQTITKD